MVVWLLYDGIDGSAPIVYELVVEVVDLVDTLYSLTYYSIMGIEIGGRGMGGTNSQDEESS